MPLCGVSTISVALLTYLLVMPLLFGGVMGWLGRLVAGWVVRQLLRVEVVVVALVRTSRMAATMSRRSFLISKSVYGISWLQVWYLPELWLASSSSFPPWRMDDRGHCWSRINTSRWPAFARNAHFFSDLLVVEFTGHVVLYMHDYSCWFSLQLCSIYGDGTAS